MKARPLASLLPLPCQSPVRRLFRDPEENVSFRTLRSEDVNDAVLERRTDILQSSDRQLIMSHAQGDLSVSGGRTPAFLPALSSGQAAN